MAASFPGELKTFIDTTGKAGVALSSEHVAAHGELAEELAAVQAALGVNLGNVAPSSHNHSAADLTSGTVATARLGSGTADNTTFLRGDQTWATPAGGSSAPDLISLARSTNQAIYTGVLTEILWNTEVEDTGGYHSTSTATGRLTVPTGKAGVFLVVATLGYENGYSSSTRTTLIKKNDTTTLADVGLGYVPGVETIVIATWAGRLADGDYINVHAYQGTGTSQNVLSTRSSLVMVRLGS